VIPKLNVKNLMLKKEVAQAVKDGKFRIYAVATVDEAIAILTGMPRANGRQTAPGPTARSISCGQEAEGNGEEAEADEKGRRSPKKEDENMTREGERQG